MRDITAIGYDTPSEINAKSEVLKQLEPLVEGLMEQHLAKRRLWYPSDLLPADEMMTEAEEARLKELRDCARGIPDGVRVSLALNLLTEEGLPHFHRLLAANIGAESGWSKWLYYWTAEEDRHGCILRDYARESRLFKMRELEMMQSAYLETGFAPNWDRDPYRVFAYTTLQERATQFSHRNTGRIAGETEPVLKEILTNVAADEAKHYAFYREVFKGVLEIDPNRALASALAIVPGLVMPGISMKNFKEMADVVRRLGIYGPWEYLRIVEEVAEYWGIRVLTGLNEAGRMAQEKLMQVPRRLKEVAEYIERRSGKKSFSFDFIYSRIFAME